MITVQKLIDATPMYQSLSERRRPVSGSALRKGSTSFSASLARSQIRWMMISVTV